MLTNLRPLISLCALCIVTAPPVVVAAQNDVAAPELSEGETPKEDEPEVITVTTQKREQSVLDVPLSVGVLSGTFLEDNGLYDLDDAAEYIPGFQLQLQQINTPSFVIRGITSDAAEPEAEPNISVFFDGIPGSRSSGSAIELFDLQRIEVAKGPQGTLFSRGASNGAINFVFRRPDEERYAEAAIQYGNFDNRRLQLILNSPLREDKAWIRLGVVYHERDGFVDNNVDDTTLNGKNTIHMRSVLRYQPSDSVTMDLIAYAQVDNPEQTAFRTIVPELEAQDPFSSYDDPTLQTPVDGFADATVDPPGELDRRVSGVTYLLDWDLNDKLRISSTSGFRRAEGNELYDLDGSSVDLLVTSEKQESEVYFQEFRFTYDSESIFSMFGGVSFYNERASLDRRVEFNQDNLFNTVLPLLTGDPLPVTISGLGNVEEQTLTRNRTTSLSAFIDGTLDIIEDTLSITGGARVTEDFKKYTYAAPTADPASALVLAFSDLSQLGPALGGDANALLAFLNSIPTNPFSPGNASLSNGSSGLLDLLGVPQGLVPAQIETNALDGTSAGQELDTSNTFEYIEPRAIVEWRPVEGLLAYGSFSRGIRSGGLDIDPRQGLQQRDYERTISKEVIRSYELGLKGAYDFGPGRITAEGAFYIYDYKDFQSVVLVEGSFRSINAGEASATGFEAAMNVALDAGLTFFGNCAFIDGGIDEGSVSDILGNEVDLSGNDFRLTPDFNVSGGVAYRLAITKELTANASILGNYRTMFFFNVENEPATAAVPQELSQDDYALFGATAGLRWEDRFGLTFRVENAFDEEYFVDLGNTGRALGVPTSIRGQPRFVTVTLDARL